MLSAVILLCLSILSFSISSISCRRVDKLRESKAHGIPVTDAAIKLIQDTCMFENDNQFMRRLAWVSTKFGTEKDAFTGLNINKGIWKLTEKKFSTIRDKWGSDTIKECKEKLQLDPSKFKWTKGDLMVPLKGALATRKFIPEKVPWSITDQANYWADHYVEHGKAQDFIDAVHDIPDPCEAAGADVLFLFDSSGSICNTRPKPKTCRNYDLMKTFAQKVISSLPLSESSYKWAVDIFGNKTEHTIHFDSYGNNEALLLEMIRNITYLAEDTHTGHALIEAANVSFSHSYGARDASKGYPRVIILLTDGKSNGPISVVKAGEIAKERGLRLFTVGIGNGINKDELNNIASDPKCMHMYLAKDFDALLKSFPTELKQRTCGSSSVVKVSSDQTTISNVVAKGIYMYFEFKATMCFGMTLSVEMHTGASGFYMSLEDRNPTEVIYDYNMDADTTNKGEIFLAPKQLNSSFVSVTVYGSIVGKQQSNSFTIKINQGDARGSSGKLEVAVINYFALGILAFLKNC